MRRIYFAINEEGRLDGGYSSSSSRVENEITIEIPEDHEIFKSSSFSFRYIDGELINDYDYEIKSLKERKFEKLSSKCEEDILGYFQAPVKGDIYSFSFDREAQSNFSGILTMFTKGLISETQWTAYLNGEVRRITLNEEEFLTVIMTAFQNKDSKIAHLRNELQPLLNAAQTIEEINAIEW